MVAARSNSKGLPRADIQLLVRSRNRQCQQVRRARRYPDHVFASSSHHQCSENPTLRPDAPKRDKFLVEMIVNVSVSSHTSVASNHHLPARVVLLLGVANMRLVDCSAMIGTRVLRGVLPVSTSTFSSKRTDGTSGAGIS